MPDELGRRIHDSICADCWEYWFKNFSIKVINELRLDLSTEHGQSEYDKHMREFMGFSEAAEPLTAGGLETHR
jgi:Fe-S cluster biosynthesis and repair protein YggX